MWVWSALYPLLPHSIHSSYLALCAVCSATPSVTLAQSSLAWIPMEKNPLSVSLARSPRYLNIIHANLWGIAHSTQVGLVCLSANTLIDTYLNSASMVVVKCYKSIYVPHGCATSVPLRNRPYFCWCLFFGTSVQSVCSKSMHTVKESVNGRRTYRCASKTEEQREL